MAGSLAFEGTAAMGKANLLPPATPRGPPCPSALISTSRALEDACNALRINGDARDRETVAARIIDLARNGVIDPVVLRDRVLTETKAMRSL